MKVKFGFNRFCYGSIAIIVLTFICANNLLVAQTGSCSDPFQLNLSDQWTTVSALSPEGMYFFEFEAQEFGVLEHCAKFGENSSELLFSCSSQQIPWTDTGIECAPASPPFCILPQTLKTFEMAPNEKIIIKMTGTEDPYGCVGPIDLRFIPSGNNCAMPTPIYCGEEIVFNTVSLTNEINFYDCITGNNNHSGQDRTFYLDVNPARDLTINMSSSKGGRDALAIYRMCNDCLSGCFMSDCEAHSITNGDEQVVLNNISGTLLIACDWDPLNTQDLNDGNEFTLSIECEPCQNDVIAPSVECPVPEIIVQAPQGATCSNVIYPQPQASDNCALDHLIFDPPVGSCFPVGTNTVEVVAVDQAGNTADCSFQIEVQPTCCLDLSHQANDPFNSGPSIDPFIMDVDNDGDQDWLRVNLATGEINYLENTNNTGYPNFDVGSGLKSIDFDNSFFSSSYYGYDYNQDGFTDIFALSGSELLYCENDGITGSPEYTVYNTGVNISSSPHFSIGDIGNDGLPDLIVGEYFSILYYQHVTGTNCNSPSQPCFELAGNSSSNPFIGSAMLEEEIPIPEIYDGDCDGDLDLYIGTVGEILWFKNDGTVTPQGNTPSFDLNPVSNPHGISNLVTTGEEFVIPRFIDIEADGDDELFIIEGNNKVQFYENCGDLVSTTWVETHRKVGIYPNPADDIFYIDVNSFRRQIASVKVYDITGLLVLTKYQDEIPLGSDKIIVDGLSKGIYIVQIESGQGSRIYGKIIIQ